MEKEEYIKQFEKHIDIARTSLVGYILRRDGFIDNRNDKEVEFLDRCISKLKKSYEIRN